MGNKGSFVFYTEYREHLSILPLEQVGELMFALMDYQETGEVPDLPKGSALAMCFSFIKARMDKDNSKYEEKCERKHYEAVYGDCVEETRAMESNSVDLIHTSIPFGNHYEYSANYNDFGHNQDTERFFEQMDFLTPELLRVLKPGRVAAIHVKDRVLFGNATGTGMPTIEPFHADCIEHYMRHGFQYFGMITVVTDVVRENNQTYRLGWTEQCKDGTKMGVGCPEYILLFRKLPTDHSKALTASLQHLTGTECLISGGTRQRIIR